MQLSGKIARSAVHGQAWLGFHFASSLFGFNSGRLSKGRLALVCFSALLSWKCWFCAVLMAWFRPVNWKFREFQEGGSPLWGNKFWGINQNLCFSASEDIEMLNEGL